MPLDIEQFVTPDTRMKVIQHLRSELALGSINSENIEYMKALDFRVSAFATMYAFELKIVLEDDGVAKSTMFDLGGVKDVPATRKEITYVAQVAEILEPGDQFPRFEAVFQKV